MIWSQLTHKESTAINLDATKEIGVKIPHSLYEPLSVNGDDTKSVDDTDFMHLCYINLKPNRFSMLAITGYLVTTSIIRFPGAGDITSSFISLDATLKHLEEN